LEFNVPFQHKYGYIRDELRVGSCQHVMLLLWCQNGWWFMCAKLYWNSSTGWLQKLLRLIWCRGQSKSYQGLYTLHTLFVHIGYTCSVCFVSYTILKVTENILVFSSYLHNILYWWWHWSGTGIREAATPLLSEVRWWRKDEARPLVVVSALMFPTVLWHWWLGDRKNIQLVKARGT